MRSLVTVSFCATVVGLATPAFAQTNGAAQFLDNCNNNRGNRDHEQYCEIRDVTVSATGQLRVDGGQNGGVSVHGSNTGQTHVTAMIQVQAATQAEAAVIARAVNIESNGAEIRAVGPNTSGDRESWSVSFDISTPRQTALTLTANNGGLSVDGIDSSVSLDTKNGGLQLIDVSGDVRGRTMNGGVNAQLTGDRWRGNGLDLQTQNGGIRLTMPENYSARLETSTVNGRLDLGFPVTVQGRIGRELATTLGNGGAMIRAVTTNGGVSIVRR